MGSIKQIGSFTGARYILTFTDDFSRYTIIYTIKDSESKFWIKAINEEVASLKTNKTWIYVDRPKNEPVIDSRWVFVWKQELDGSIRHKARLVVQGFKDHHQYDYSEIYAPVAGLTDVRALLAIANKFDWSLVQMDVKTTFLNGELTVCVYEYI